MLQRPQIKLQLPLEDIGLLLFFYMIQMLYSACPEMITSSERMHEHDDDHLNVRRTDLFLRLREPTTKPRVRFRDQRIKIMGTDLRREQILLSFGDQWIVHELLLHVFE